MENKLSLSLSTVDGSASVVSECNTTCIVVVVVLVMQWNLQRAASLSSAKLIRSNSFSAPNSVAVLGSRGAWRPLLGCLGLAKMALAM